MLGAEEAPGEDTSQPTPSSKSVPREMYVPFPNVTNLTGSTSLSLSVCLSLLSPLSFSMSLSQRFYLNLLQQIDAMLTRVVSQNHAGC